MPTNQTNLAAHSCRGHVGVEEDLPDQSTRIKIKGETTEIVNASPNPFGRLPDAVLLQILQGIHDISAQQAAYQSCKDIRDFCNRNMKSVTVQIHPGESGEVQMYSSKTVRPQTAFGIEKLTLYHLSYNILKPYHPVLFDNAYNHLQQLFNDTLVFPIMRKDCRRKQLANISSIDLCLPFGPWEQNMTDMTDNHCLMLSRLLSRFQKLQTLATDINAPLPFLNVPQLQQLTLRSPITLRDLYLFAMNHPNLHKLEFAVEDGKELDLYVPALNRLPALRQLAIKARGRATLPAAMLTTFTQLSSLALHFIDINDPHALTQLTQLTRLTLESVTANNVEEQQQTAQWSALKRIEFAAGLSDVVPISEALARAVLPIPHPGFNVIWPISVSYHVDEFPAPKFGNMGVVHMKSVDELHLSGKHMRYALQELLYNKVMIRTLHVCDGPREISIEDVASCFAFPSVITMELDNVVNATPKVFQQLFLQCPSLESLRVLHAQISSFKELEQSLGPFGVQLSAYDDSLLMGRFQH